MAALGDQKFEAIMSNRTLAFRAESDVERKEWMQALQRARASYLVLLCWVFKAQSCLTFAGSLELHGIKNNFGDKVKLYKNLEEYHLGIGFTFIDMSEGNMKEVGRRSFDLTMPYRIFGFSAELEKEQWLEAMQGAIAETLSTSEVADHIWAVAPNRCGASQPYWASINLCVIICKRCVGKRHGMGAGVSEVRSLKMDRKVWTETLIQLS
ncbi:Arf-GAP with Rho-GAP domain, ANK repeat and PH domain-containing protein 1 [Myotis davidii]|uniref:Arf-GAP with Rho-GAP domain, ANK repeat and PH domain-containing protein 1 n=1 Tax=Myotis davidii TaxID=225400 RepID=L5LVI0_MYODS|nr:Arf-GAP with Rho-GAP domain, ANK repeat and PH domain-containing protein 1 [Myotis davidii]